MSFESLEIECKPRIKVLFLNLVLMAEATNLGTNHKAKSLNVVPGGGGTPYIQMIGMIVVFFRGCNR